jgi:DNA-binding NarL/FixJ family response regulator
MMRIRILLADDHKIVRDGLRAMISGHPDMEVVAEAENGRAAVSLVKQLAPDIVIMDISMPDLNGIEAARHIVADAPRVKIIALSMHSDGHYVKELFKAGASGYLLKDCAFEELANAIHTVAADQIYLSPRISHVVINDYLNRVSTEKNSIFSVLTAREREVLQLLAEGKTTKEIAYTLDLSTKTVEAHRQKIMEKSNLHSVAELTKYAIREGLTSLES